MPRWIWGLIIFVNASAFGQSSNPWKDLDEKPMLAAAATRSGSVAARRNIIPQSYRSLALDRSSLENILAAAPPESTGPLDVTGNELTIPLPDGSLARFNVQESLVMDPKLAAKYPEIKTYVGQGIDDPSASVRLDLTPAGFHAMILSSKGQVFVDPYWRNSDASYVSYYKRDYLADKPFSCLVQSEAREQSKSTAAASERPTGATLRKYRLALACTAEYAAAVCSPNQPTISQTLAAMVTSVNRVSAIYEREFAIRFLLIGNTDSLIFLDVATEPYTNANGSTMLSQNQTTIDNIIGSANYDFGHVFSTGGGGVAYLGVICVAGSKAGGVTGTSNPLGDPYDVDYVAHEMGHQFAADHPFNSTVGSCGGGNRNTSTAYEVGSGVSIMAYAGICSNTNLAAHSDDYFHTISYTEIDNYTSSGTGASCPVTNSTGNNPPVLDSLGTFTIPANTPFALTGSATDADGDTITYDWEEFDLGAAQTTQNPSPSINYPIFRSYEPNLSPTRYFPSLTYILNNANVAPATNADGYATGEVLPSIARTMTFRLTARDNHPGGGGSNWTSTTVTTVVTGSTFAVTSPNTSVSFAGGSQQTVTWDVAGSDANGINCANVKISLSTDGGNTFPTVLASSVPNNGSALITIPQIATTQGRIKVEAVGNIFFDISDANFTITSSNNAPTINISGSITVARGTPTATIATVGTVADMDGDALTIAVSNLPYRVTITPSLVGSNISVSALVDCGLTTTLTTRTYPFTITVTDSHGATASATANLVVTPNVAPSLGTYPNVNLSQSSSATSTPSAPAADANGNLVAPLYSITPTTLPGGGTLSINQNNGVVTVTTTSGSTLNVTTPVRVTVLDACGAAAVQIFNVKVISINPVLQAGTASGPTTESCPPTNGTPDPGETVTVSFPINNIGGGATSNLVATLQNSGGATPITTSQTYGAIMGNGSGTKAFQFVANGTCGGTITATLQLQDGATSFGSVSYIIRLGVLPIPFSQNFDSNTAPNLPSGWSAVVASGAMIPWATNTTSPDTSPNSVSATTVTAPSDNRLTSTSVAIPAGSPQLSFRHRWNLESGYDGGIFEMSVNGGAFTDIVTAGGSFVSGAYNGTISPSYNNPIAGANAWTGSSNSTYTTTLVNLPASAAGQNAQFRWRLGCDDGVGGGSAIWRIDTVNLISSTYVCSSCSVAPAITNGPPFSPVVVGTFYTYTFTATGAPAPTFGLTSGLLPPGLNLATNGVLSGTPTSAGSGSFPNITITASNGVLPDAHQTFSLAAVTNAANYIASFGLSGGNAAFLYDYDLDGISNLIEYALGLDPANASISGLPVVTLKDYSGTKYLSMTLVRSSVATDITYVVQGSSDLVGWSDLGTSAAGTPMSGLGVVSEAGSAPTYTDEVRDTISLGAVPRFLRLKVTSP